MANQVTYSFADTHITYTTMYGVVIPIEGNIDDGGITFDYVDDKSSMVNSADGKGWMHSLHAAKGATATLGLLKTSAINGLLWAQYNIQIENASLFGNDQITLTNLNTGDVLYAQGVAFKKAPPIKFAKDGGTFEWVFNIGRFDAQLGL